jgi:hypothetical protein
MLVSYSQESSIQSAFQEVFSGERPCGLCKIIQASDPSETKLPNKTKAPADELRLLLAAPPTLHLRPMEHTTKRMATVPVPVDSAYERVPTPPPKQRV